jgi:DNA-binding NarL/FixJ family response regulator
MQAPPVFDSDLLRQSRRLRRDLQENVQRLQQKLRESRAVLTEPDTLLSRPVAVRPGPAPATLGIIDSLTKREVEVLRLIAEGKSTKEVAGEMGIAFKTAVCHRSRILQKLGVHETASLVRLAIRAGLIDA